MKIAEILSSSHSSGANIPLGRFDVIPSAVTGAPLRYFTPDPLSLLLARCVGECSDEAPRPMDQAFVLLLARSAATDHSGSVNASYAKLVAQTALGHVRYIDSESILKLGSCISPRAREARQEIVFSGAVSASASKHVYPPYEALPTLLTSLADGLNCPPEGMDASVFAAVVGFFCVHVHPFLDGNGRWSRVLSTQAGALLKGSDSGVISAIFQSRFKHALAHSIWPSARLTGLKEYLQMAKSFEAALRSGVEPEVVELSGLALSALKRHFISRRDYEEAAIAIFTDREVDIRSLLKDQFNLSDKRQRWLTEELDEIASRLNGSTHSNFFMDAAAAVDAAVKYAQNSLSRSFN